MSTSNSPTKFSEVSIALPSRSCDQSPQSSQVSSSSSSLRPTLVSGGSPARRTATGLSGRHSVFRGIRLRNGKWVSEIREPRKKTRIWLGTYPVPEMAAAAYDVAVLALKGSGAVLNFPHLALTYLLPASTSAADIRAAVARAVEMKQPDPGGAERVVEPDQSGKEEEKEASSSLFEFMDEEAMLNMPTLLAEMAEGMLMSPPRVATPTLDDSPDNQEGYSLWSFK